jgi:hypothetical protein
MFQRGHKEGTVLCGIFENEWKNIFDYISLSRISTLRCLPNNYEICREKGSFLGTARYFKNFKPTAWNTHGTWA